MSFDIDIRGLDELERESENMRESLAPSVVDDWCKRIESEAKENCPHEERASIVINAVPKESQVLDIELKSSKKALPCISDAVQRNVLLMPVTTKAIFQTQLKQIEKRKSEEEGS